MYWAVAIRHDSAMMAQHPSAAGPPRNSWVGGEYGRGRRGEFGRFRRISPPSIIRIAKVPAFRDIAPAKDDPSIQFQWAIYVRISELRPRWHKMGRKMRRLSAAPHQDRCGKMGEEFPEYTIAIRLARGILPIGRGVHRKGHRRRTLPRYVC